MLATAAPLTRAADLPQGPLPAAYADRLAPHLTPIESILAAPVASQWRGVVITAPSNTGKTTTALALAGSGWRLLGDDVTYVRPPNLGTAVWGFPRACNIRPGTLQLMPWLRSLSLFQEAEGCRS